MCFFRGKYHLFPYALLAVFTVNAIFSHELEQPRKSIGSCNEAYKQLFGSCDAKPIAPYEYYYPKPEQQPDSDSPGEKPSDKPKEKKIYIAGWEISTIGITMAFVTDDGEPYYPTDYQIETLRDCAADVSINGIRHALTCMPDKMAYAEIKNGADSAMQ